MNSNVFTCVVIPLVICLLCVVGCEQSQQGAQIMVREKCFECHSLAGNGGGVGPDLTRVGSRRTREYIIQQIKEPQSHKPDSAMPSFKHLSEQDLNAVADYLSTRK